MAELKFSSHFRSEEMVVPRNVNDLWMCLDLVRTLAVRLVSDF